MWPQTLTFELLQLSLTSEELNLLSSLVLYEKSVLYRCVKTELTVELLNKLKRGINSAPGIFRNEGLTTPTTGKKYWRLTMVEDEGY